MPINKDKSERLQLTVSKKQADWIHDKAKRLGMSTSSFVKWLINKNLGNALGKLNQIDQRRLSLIADDPIPQSDEEIEIENEEKEYTEEEMQDLIRIAHTKWVNEE